MKKLIEFDEKCRDCGGTGLYVGMGESGGAAVECAVCKGTGCHSFRHEYEEFTGRLKRPGVTRVYEVNPGICIGEGNGFRLKDFGGLPLADWEAGASFGPGTENRRFTCPCWWYQTADYKLKPTWRECDASVGVGFSRCPHFEDKSGCWYRWDREFGGAPEELEKRERIPKHEAADKD
jgi:hypothetical protein